MIVDPVIDAAFEVVKEKERRIRGEDPDRRFDIPISMLRDLADELELPSTKRAEPSS